MLSASRGGWRHVLTRLGQFVLNRLPVRTSCNPSGHYVPALFEYVQAREECVLLTTSWLAATAPLVTVNVVLRSVPPAMLRAVTVPSVPAAACVSWHCIIGIAEFSSAGRK